MDPLVDNDLPNSTARFQLLDPKGSAPVLRDEVTNVGQRIFVFGAARSGTTLVNDFLNIAPDCLILSEADLPISLGFKDFRAYFHARRLKVSPVPNKGGYIPSFVRASATGSEVLEALSEKYRIVGDKIAFGPGRSDLLAIIEAFGNHFFDATYVVCLREPLTNILSMRKMFPEASDIEIYNAWANSVFYSLVIAANFPKVHLILHSSLSTGLLNRLANRLGISAHLDSELAVGAAHIRTLVGNRDEPIISHHNTLFSQCQDLFSEIAGSYEESEFRLAYAPNAVEFMKNFLSRAQDLVVASGGRKYHEIALDGASFLGDQLERQIQSRFDLNDYSLPTGELIETLLKERPSSPHGHYFMGLYLQVSKGPHSAILEHYRRALELGHNEFWVRYNRACFLFDQGQTRLALEDAVRVFELRPNSAESNHLVEQAAQAGQDIPHAIQLPKSNSATDVVQSN